MFFIRRRFSCFFFVLASARVTRPLFGSGRAVGLREARASCYKSNCRALAVAMLVSEASGARFRCIGFCEAGATEKRFCMFSPSEAGATEEFLFLSIL